MLPLTHMRKLKSPPLLFHGSEFLALHINELTPLAAGRFWHLSLRGPHARQGGASACRPREEGWHGCTQSYLNLPPPGGSHLQEPASYSPQASGTRDFPVSTTPGVSDAAFTTC